jgi:outer membrane protein
VRLDLGVQRLAAVLGERHRVSLSAGVGIVNARYNETYFGVTPLEASRSRFHAWQPGGGLQDVHAGVRWNWVLSPVMDGDVEPAGQTPAGRRQP